MDCVVWIGSHTGLAVSTLSNVIIAELGLVGKIVGKTTDAASSAMLSALFGPGTSCSQVPIRPV
jgi:hypothetical protein